MGKNSHGLSAFLRRHFVEKNSHGPLLFLRRRWKDLPTGWKVLLAVFFGVAISFAAYHFMFVSPEPPQPQHFEDNFDILPREDHNVHAIEAYGTLAVAFISVVIAYLIWRTVQATLEEVESHRELVEATKKEVDSNRALVEATSREVASNQELVASNQKLVASNNELVKTQTKAIRTSAIQTIGREMLKIDRWMADHPEYRDALERPAAEPSALGAAVAEVYADLIAQVHGQKDFLNEDNNFNWANWEEYFKDIIKTWPQLRKFVDEYPEWYGNALNDLWVEETT